MLVLPNGHTFDGLRIVERQERGRYLYSFAGSPTPWPANLIDAPRPVYFVKSVHRLVVVHDRDLAAQLQSVLTGR